jgi:FkbM family methyltransferase
MVPIRLPGLPEFLLAVHSKTDRFISSQLRERGAWEPLETRIALASLDAGDTFIDLGANLGYYTVLVGLRVGPTGRGFAFEPEPDNFALLERNLAMNGLTHVTAEHCAVSDRNGAASLHVSADNQGDHRLYDSGDKRGVVPARTVTLDAFFGDSARFPEGSVNLRLVKMDTQGCEALILRGAGRLVAEQGARIVWMIEFWPF